MLRFKKDDPFLQIFLQALSIKPVDLDVWLDMMVELTQTKEEDDISSEQMLEENGLCAEDVLKEAERYWVDLHDRMAKRRLSFDDRFQLCIDLFTQAQKDPSPELLRIFCEVLHDPEMHYSFYQDAEDNPANQAVIYLSFCEDRDFLLTGFMLRQELSKKFSEAIKEKRNPRPTDCDTIKKYEIAHGFIESFELPENKNVDLLLGNLENYIQIVEASPGFKSIAPLVLFRLLTKHKSRMCTVPDLNVRLSALWKPDNQQVEKDNGRNFKQYERNLCFFQQLCKIYEDYEEVDLTLCWYGLDEITVLGDFCRKNILLDYEGCDSEYPFVPVVEELIDDGSIFEMEHSNIMLEDSALTEKEFSKFQKSKNPFIRAALKKITDYINEHQIELAIQIARADVEKTKALCQSVLEKSEIQYRPKSPHDIELFLAAVNDKLLQAESSLADYLLYQTGHTLLHEPTEILEWIE